VHSGYRTGLAHCDCHRRTSLRSGCRSERGHGAVERPHGPIKGTAHHDPPSLDLRREPIERRKVLLIRLLAKASAGLQVNDHIVAPGDVVFRHACQLGFEGIVSKRLGSPYRSGSLRYWVKSKNPQHPAVKREAEEDWGR
jgi:hypothetical protein